jgi:small multidrug resistance pump
VLTWVLLAGAIASEVMGTISLRFSEGFSKLVPSILVVVGYAGAFVLLSMVLQRGMALGVAYAVWAAAGVSLVALIGAAFLGETLTPVQIGGLVAVIGGVVALELGAAH